MSDVHSTGALRQQPEAVGQDRELLELAALAAGMVVLPADKPWAYGAQGWFFNEHSGGGMFNNYSAAGIRWNPLHDDGDALRLALRLGLSLSRRCALYAERRWMTESDEDEVCSATRRAIVRAAAAIGSEIQQTASGSRQEARSNEQGCAACATCGKPWGEST